MRISRLPIIAVPLAALAIAGCGGGGGGTSDTTQAKKAEAPKQLTKAEFIAQGDGICGEVNSAVGSIDEGEAGLEEQAAEVAGLYTGMIERITKLGTPAEMDGYAEFSEASEELAKVEGEVKAAAEKEEIGALEEASNAAVPALEQFQSAAAVYGFEACSEGPSAPSTAGATGAAGSEEAGAEEGGLESESEYVEPEYVEPELEAAPEEEFVPETGGAGGGVEEGGGGEEEVAPEESESGGVGAG